MARQGMAPKLFSTLNHRGVPVTTVGVMLVVLLIGVGLQLTSDTAAEMFQNIAALATFATVFVWLMILLAHLASRYRHRVDPATLSFTVPLWPLGQLFSIAVILVTFGTMVWMDQYHSALWAGVIFLVLMSVLYPLTRRRTRAEHDTDTNQGAK